MRVLLAYLGAAAAIALSLPGASAVRQAPRQSPTENEASTEPKVPTCEKAELPLSISAANGTAAFRCHKELQLLSPEYRGAVEKQEVYVGNETKVLSTVLRNAKLEKREVPAAGEKNPSRNSEVGLNSPSKENVYILTVPELPTEETKISFKCQAASPGEHEKVQNSPREEGGNNPSPKECKVTVTVASSAGASAAFQPALITPAIAGLLSTIAAGVLQLRA
ncbi:SAG-related sequence [Besnoitia besnoiti]|uniref:SAG-related sequence n=1 Tax=Besnoitia besnoiti TaxID=94643 RepID=A0A2A9MC50_BESBE|nr:SAG-related sequence [Besnoitia besnoiti]PFH32970.1 SAG-related sequence [Besnoitia besnoiti]